MDAVGTWWHNLLQNILKDMYEGMYGLCENLFNGMFNSLNADIATSSQLLTQNPQNWNDAGFAMIRNIAETACIPIAGGIITFIFCWELIHLMQDSNKMQAVKPETIMTELIKLFLCLVACSKSFEIIMGFYDIGAWAATKVGGISAGSLGNGLDLSMILVRPTGEYEVKHVLELCSNWILLGICSWITKIIGVVIFFMVNIWFIELLVHSSAAPIPFSTFGNKEWSQVGLNYTRKMLALSFQGFFMLVAFSLYGAIVTNIINSVGNADFNRAMLMNVGCGFLLIIILFRTGQISSSIFNAH